MGEQHSRCIRAWRGRRRRTRPDAVLPHGALPDERDQQHPDHDDRAGGLGGLCFLSQPTKPDALVEMK